MRTKSKNPAEGDAQRHQYRLAYQIENLDGKHPQGDPNQCCNAVLSYSQCDPGAKRARLHHKLYHANKFSKVHYHSQGCGHQNYQSQSHRNISHMQEKEEYQASIKGQSQTPCQTRLGPMIQKEWPATKH